MADPRHVLGLAAEAATERWLTSAGWQVIDRRRRTSGGGEIDLVALDRERVLVAVEVRARTTARTGAAVLSVDGRRVARLRRSLAEVAASCGLRHRGLRVDLVSAEPLSGRASAWRLTRLPDIG